MPRLQTLCPLCQKPLELKEEIKLGSSILQSFKCGHLFSKEKLAEIEDANLELTALDGSGHKARPYQTEGVKFLINAVNDNGGALNGDQMRLGKTIQALLAARNLKKSPTLVLARAANIFQWVRETKKWKNNLPNGVWIIQGTKNFIPEGFDVYIMSMDTFGRRGTCKHCKHQYHDEECTKCEKEEKSCRICVPTGDAMSDILLAFGFQLVIVDEAHSFKNTDSQRSRALTAFLKEIERSTLVHEITFNCPMCKHAWEETVTVNIDTTEESKRVRKTSHCEKCSTQVTVSAATHVKVARNCSVIMLTGTAIKNRADEYFVPLNLIAPEKFPSLANFQHKWLVQDSKGKYSRVSPLAIDSFKREIAPYVIRREKEDIYKDLPKLNRIFTPIKVTDERLKKAYNKVLDQIEEKSPNGNFQFFNSIGELQQLRQICGLAKVGFVADYAEGFVSDSETSKLAIGYHHHSVRDALWGSLESYGVCKLDGQDSPHTKDYIAHKYFEKAPEQILLLGEQACKEGIELVYIDYALVTERQWNAAEEEQFEFRFYNPDLDYLKSRGLENKVTTIEYILADGTIDSFFYEMVEEKRGIFGETVANNWSLESDPMSFKQLMEKTVAGRL